VGSHECAGIRDLASTLRSKSTEKLPDRSWISQRYRWSLGWLTGVVAASRRSCRRELERAMGIEPTSKAWEAYDITQKHAGLAAFLQFPERLNWKIMENGKRPLLISANVPDSSGPEVSRADSDELDFNRRPPGPEPSKQTIYRVESASG
jgi:hypothetical protein